MVACKTWQMGPISPPPFTSPALAGLQAAPDIHCGHELPQWIQVPGFTTQVRKEHSLCKCRECSITFGGIFFKKIFFKIFQIILQTWGIFPKCAGKYLASTWPNPPLIFKGGDKACFQVLWQPTHLVLSLA